MRYYCIDFYSKRLNMFVVKLAVTLTMLVMVRGDDQYTSDQMTSMIYTGLGNIARETINAPVTLDSGNIPSWLSGNFMRHSCGAFGETSNMDISQPNYITHLFDCLEIGSKFRVHNGEITFTNRWYDTVNNDIYNVYNRDMNQSSVWFTGAYAKVNATQSNKWRSNMSDPSKIADMPHVSWWQIGNEAIAQTEIPIGVIIDPETVQQKGKIYFLDDNLGEPWSSIMTNNPAHEHTEPDGTLWSTVSVVNVTKTLVKTKRIVYKVGADRIRIPVGQFEYADADLTRCVGNKQYPDASARFGYLHSFSMTENYIVLPETSYSYNPCLYTNYDNTKSSFPQAYEDQTSGHGRLLVMRKSDGEFIANIQTVPFFVTHQLGSYEDDDQIHMDMLVYNDAAIYTKHTYLSGIIDDDTYVTDVMRISINTSDWSYKMRNLRNGGPAAFEMSNINYDYNTKKYTYAYMVRNFLQKGQNALTKLNVETGAETEYVVPVGMYLQEPQFIARPGETREDGGVLIAQGVDGRKQKAFMIIVDAVTMTLIAHVTAPDIALFGIHERMFPLSVGQSSAQLVFANFLCVAVLVLVTSMTTEL